MQADANAITGSGVNPAALSALKVVGVAVLITLSTLFIYLNHRFFNWIFKEKAKKYWWVFVATTIFPFLLFLFIYQLLFDGNPDTNTINATSGIKP